MRMRSLVTECIAFVMVRIIYFLLGFVGTFLGTILAVWYFYGWILDDPHVRAQIERGWPFLLPFSVGIGLLTALVGPVATGGPSCGVGGPCVRFVNGAKTGIDKAR